MELIYCPNCAKRSGFKRALGFGTFFMVLITFGLWLLVIPLYPVRCVNCGLGRMTAFWENLRSNPRRAITTSSVSFALLALVWIFVRLGDHPPQNAPESERDEPYGRTAALRIDPREQRLSDLRKRKETLDVSLAVEQEVTRTLLRDVNKLSSQPFPDPEERQYLIESMDKEHKIVAELLEERKAIDAEIAKEEQSNATSSLREEAPGSSSIARWPDVTFLGFRAGESVPEFGLHATTLGMTQAGDCKAREEAAEYSDCHLSGNGESIEASFYNGQLQRIDYEFGVGRYVEILRQLTDTYGVPKAVHLPSNPSSELSEDWGGGGVDFDVSLSKTADGRAAVALFTFSPSNSTTVAVAGHGEPADTQK